MITVERLDDINIILSGCIDHDGTLERDTEGQMLEAFVEAAMKEAKVLPSETLGQPDFKKYEKTAKNICIEVAIATKPHIDTNVDYTDIVPSFTKPKTDPKDMQKSIDDSLIKLSQQHAPFSKIEESRLVKDGDLVILDFEGFLNGRALKGANEEGYKLKIGSRSFMPGFEEQILGMSVNEKKTVKVTFPKDYKAKELAGKETEFHVELKEIREQLALDIDDALAKKVLQDKNATLDTLKATLTKQLSSQAFSKLYNDTLKPQLIKGLLAKFEFTLPNNAVEQEVDAKVNAKAQQMSKEERTHYQDDKEKFQDLRESLRVEARASIKAALIVDALAKKEVIEVSEEEVISTLTQQAINADKDPEEFVEYYQTNNLMTSATMGLIEDKLFSQMLGV
jgi:trigger factor